MSFRVPEHPQDSRPRYGSPSTLEVLAEEWLALRQQGIHTPSIAAWPTTACGAEMCMGTKAVGYNYTMLYTAVVYTQSSPSTISNDNCLVCALPIACPCFRMLSLAPDCYRTWTSTAARQILEGHIVLLQLRDLMQTSTCARGLASRANSAVPVWRPLAMFQTSSPGRSCGVPSLDAS